MKQNELFKISTEDLNWNLASGETTIYNDEVYIETDMDRTEAQQKSQLTKASVTVNIPIGHSLASFILISYFEQIVTLTIFQKIDEDFTVFWKGRLASYQPAGENLALVFESIFTSMRRPGLRATFQRNCRFALYGKGCEIDPETFVVPATVTSIDSVLMVIPEAAAYADGFFTGGMVKAPDGTLSYIVSHIGTAISVQRMSKAMIESFALVGSGMNINIYPGCDHSRLTCNSKFGNDIKYGGFDWIPDKNPMGGDSII